MRRYTKEDVETRFQGYDRYTSEPRNLPCVNVKTRPWAYDEFVGEIATEYDDADFVDWCVKHNEDQRLWDRYWEFACESGWELLQSDAEDIFSGNIYPVRVESDGRSGGWAVVHGLPPVEEWDAIALGRWRRFEKWARSIADDVPRSMVELAYINTYEREREECKRNTQAWNVALLESLGVVA